MHPIPSFAARAWGDSFGVSESVRIEIGADAPGACNTHVVSSFCSAMIDDLVRRIGLTGELSCQATRTTGSRDVVVRVHEVVRAVFPGDAHVAGRHRTSWPGGLDGLDELAVTALERVLLDDPGLLVLPGLIALSTFAAHDDLPVSVDDLRALASRHIRLDAERIRSASILADTSDLRIGQLTALCNDHTLSLEVPPGMSDDDAETVLQLVREGVEAARASGGNLPEPVLASQDDIDASATLAGSAQLLLGGFPLAVLRLEELGGLQEAALAMSAELRRAVYRTWDGSTTKMRLDRLAVAFPQTVSALRSNMSDVLTAEVLRAAGEGVGITDLADVVDRLVEPAETDVAGLVGHVRPSLVERHITAIVRGTALPVFVLPADVESALVEGHDGVGEALMRAAAGLLPGSAWDPVPAAIVVDTHDARRAVRAQLRPQAPDLNVLQASELPGWVDVEWRGELKL